MCSLFGTIFEKKRKGRIDETCKQNKHLCVRACLLTVQFSLNERFELNADGSAEAEA